MYIYHLWPTWVWSYPRANSLAQEPAQGLGRTGRYGAQVQPLQEGWAFCSVQNRFEFDAELVWELLSGAHNRCASCKIDVHLKPVRTVYTTSGDLFQSSRWKRESKRESQTELKESDIIGSLLVLCAMTWPTTLIQAVTSHGPNCRMWVAAQSA